MSGRWDDFSYSSICFRLQWFSGVISFLFLFSFVASKGSVWSVGILLIFPINIYCFKFQGGLGYTVSNEVSPDVSICLMYLLYPTI